MVRSSLHVRVVTGLCPVLRGVARPPHDSNPLELWHAVGALQLHPHSPEGRTSSASRRLDRAIHAARTPSASWDGWRVVRPSGATLQLQRLRGLPDSF